VCSGPVLDGFLLLQPLTFMHREREIVPAMRYVGQVVLAVDISCRGQAVKHVSLLEHLGTKSVLSV